MLYGIGYLAAFVFGGFPMQVVFDGRRPAAQPQVIVQPAGMAAIPGR